MKHIIDAEIMKHLKEYRAEVLSTVAENGHNIGELLKVDTAIVNEDYNALIEIGKENNPLLEVILESEY